MKGARSKTMGILITCLRTLLSNLKYQLLMQYLMKPFNEGLGLKDGMKNFLRVSDPFRPKSIDSYNFILSCRGTKLNQNV